MKKILQACRILEELGLPKEQTNERAAYVLLALAQIGPDTPWHLSTDGMYTTRDIMDFIASSYGKEYKPNTRETIRRFTLHQFEQAQLVIRNHDEPKRPTNSPKNNYKLAPVVIDILRDFPDGPWRDRVRNYITSVGSLKEQYAKRIEYEKIPIKLPNGDEVRLSPGEHNQLHKDIVEEFTPRFIKGDPRLLYLGDTASSRLNEGGKLLLNASEELKRLGISPMSHSKLPDVVIFEAEREWLFLIEAVTSHGPVSHKRHIELEMELSSCHVGRVYVTAFPDLTRFKRYANDIAWDTEVWISEIPDHMIHFNGDRFLGPR